MIDAFLDAAARVLATGYVAYLFVLAATSWFGCHLVALGVMIGIAWRRRDRTNRPFAVGERAYPLQLIYGFINPAIYLLVLGRDGALLRWNALDPWLTAIAWTLFIALWGARLIVAREVEVAPRVRTMLYRLCVLGLVCLAAFALRDLLRIGWPAFNGTSVRGRSLIASLWVLVAYAPLYLIPAVILNSYRLRLAQAPDHVRFLLFSRPAAHRAGVALATVASFVVVGSLVPTSETTARARVARLAPAIHAAAERYSIDPTLVAAIVYVSEREVGPFRDQVERFASGMFLMDAESHMMLSKRFDLSIGAAQIKPVTALTALKLCRASGQPWEVWGKHLRDVPPLGQAWEARPSMRDICHPPTTQVPLNKEQVVTALRDDDSNVAFAAMILALYQWQWRDANAGWDISDRPEILATLYQIGFGKSRPHAAPRSSAFGQRVAEVSREPWLRQHFDRSRVALRADPRHYEHSGR